MSGDESTSGSDHELLIDHDELVALRELDENSKETVCYGYVTKYKYTLFVELWKQAGPIIASNGLEMALYVVSLLFIGRMGPEILAGGTLGIMIVNVTGLAFLFGLATALDTQCSNAFGAGNKPLVGRACNAAALVLFCSCVCTSLFWTQSEKMMLVFGQKPEVARIASRFIVASIASLYPAAAAEVAKAFLQTQEITAPVTWAMLATNLFHALITYVLVYPVGLGIAGVPIALACSLSFFVCLLCGYIYTRSLHVGVWTAKDWWRVRWVDVKEFLRLGIPGTFAICFEWWAFEVSAVVAGLLPGLVPLDAQGILIDTGMVMWMTALGLSIASGNIVGNLLGAGLGKRAHDMAVIASQCVGITAVTGGLTLFSVRHVWGYLYTPSPRVVEAVADVLPILCLFQIVDGLQGVGGGVARGCGLQRYSAVFSGVAFYVIGWPIGALLLTTTNWGLAAIWWGLLSGLTVSCVLYMRLLFWKIDWDEQAELARARAEADEVAKSSRSEHELVSVDSESEAYKSRDSSGSELSKDE